MYKCWDCLGSGKKEYYNQIDKGICYTCKGTGKTNKSQGEESRTHKENQDNIALHYRIVKRIENGSKMKNELCANIGKKIGNGGDVQEDLNTLTKYTNLLKALEVAKEKLENIITW